MDQEHKEALQEFRLMCQLEATHKQAAAKAVQIFKEEQTPIDQKDISSDTLRDFKEAVSSITTNSMDPVTHTAPGFDAFFQDKWLAVYTALETSPEIAQQILLEYMKYDRPKLTYQDVAILDQCYQEAKKDSDEARTRIGGRTEAMIKSQYPEIEEVKNISVSLSQKTLWITTLMMASAKTSLDIDTISAYFWPKKRPVEIALEQSNKSLAEKLVEYQHCFR